MTETRRTKNLTVNFCWKHDLLKEQTCTKYLLKRDLSPVTFRFQRNTTWKRFCEPERELTKWSVTCHILGSRLFMMWSQKNQNTSWSQICHLWPFASRGLRHEGALASLREDYLMKAILHGLSKEDLANTAWSEICHLWPFASRKIPFEARLVTCDLSLPEELAIEDNRFASQPSKYTSWNEICHLWPSASREILHEGDIA